MSREPLYIDSSHTPFVIIPSNTAYHSREVFLKEIEKTTGCKIYSIALEEHVTIIVSEEHEDITQILLQGTNKIILTLTQRHQAHIMVSSSLINLFNI